MITVTAKAGYKNGESFFVRESMELEKTVENCSQIYQELLLKKM
jgi:hypothetical protein